MNIDRERIYIRCPRCNFFTRPFLRQIRHQDTMICSGCKANIHLVDYIGQYRKAHRQIRQAVESLTEQFRNFNVTLRL
jgi:hypothetical protein